MVKMGENARSCACGVLLQLKGMLCMYGWRLVETGTALRLAVVSHWHTAAVSCGGDCVANVTVRSGLRGAVESILLAPSG